MIMLVQALFVPHGVVAGISGRLILGAFCFFEDVVNAAQVRR
jgi:hypothetical protein